MSLRDQLLAQKQEGQREYEQKQAEEQARAADDAAQARAEQETKRAAEAAKDRMRAEAVFATLPAIVRNAARNGQDRAVLVDGFISDRRDADTHPHAIAIGQKTYYAKGWQATFCGMCKAGEVPLTVVTERVDVGIGKVLGRAFHALAVDLTRL